jgi:hypothetical protein
VIALEQIDLTAAEEADPRQHPAESMFVLHPKSPALADKFEFGFMESVETHFEEILVTEAKATSTVIVAQTGAYENWEERWRNKR